MFDLGNVNARFRSVAEMLGVSITADFLYKQLYNHGTLVLKKDGQTFHVLIENGQIAAKFGAVAQFDFNLNQFRSHAAIITDDGAQDIKPLGIDFGELCNMVTKFYDAGFIVKRTYSDGSSDTASGAVVVGSIMKISNLVEVPLSHTYSDLDEPFSGSTAGDQVCLGLIDTRVLLPLIHNYMAVVHSKVPKRSFEGLLEDPNLMFMMDFFCIERLGKVDYYRYLQQNNPAFFTEVTQLHQSLAGDPMHGLRYEKAGLVVKEAFDRVYADSLIAQALSVINALGVRAKYLVPDLLQCLPSLLLLGRFRELSCLESSLKYQETPDHLMEVQRFNALYSKSSLWAEHGLYARFVKQVELEMILQESCMLVSSSALKVVGNSKDFRRCAMFSRVRSAETTCINFLSCGGKGNPVADQTRGNLVGPDNTPWSSPQRPPRAGRIALEDMGNQPIQPPTLLAGP